MPTENVVKFLLLNVLEIVASYARKPEPPPPPPPPVTP